ncbi:MAG TPA: hypothetical protein DDW28_01250 [Prevotella sp.]|nr:porin family protein [uncultured Prevotella sp.]HBF04781.1 hypothetical protein [Candidatus Segatella violae]
MKKLLVMAAMMLSTVGAFAQYSAGDITVQPKVGLNIADLTDIDDSKTRAGVVAGAELEYHVSPMFGISGGLLYSMQGCKGKEEGVEATIKNDYLNIPILANVYVAQGLALKAGVQPGFKVNSKVTAKANGASVTADLDDAFKSFDLSIPVGVSYEYMNFCLDARYNIGVTKVMDNTDCKNSVFQLTLGYKFKL